MIKSFDVRLRTNIIFFFFFFKEFMILSIVEQVLNSKINKIINNKYHM